MKITKSQLRRIIKEERAKLLEGSLADDAYGAGYHDALRDRPHGSNPDMRDLDPKAYDHGFDKGTADRMDMQRPLGTKGFYESDIKESFADAVNQGREQSRAREKAEFGQGSAFEEAAQMIYYALLDVEDELVDRDVELRMGEFAKAIEQAMQRFK